MSKIRINKFLADSGISSRRKSEEYISQGRVAVNDKVISDLGFKIDIEKDVVTLDGEKIKPKRHIYILLNKPKGYITSVSDEKSFEGGRELLEAVGMKVEALARITSMTDDRIVFAE